MLSWKSSANVKIIGVQGLTPEIIRDEIARGARFVIYHYCISIVVMTFKRPSNIYFIKPGQNRIIKGLPFDLISLVLGWWGFPWGPIYTLQVLANNLLGGINVTDEILASLAPAPSTSVPSPQPAAASPAFGAPKSAEPSSGKKIAVGVAIIAVLAAAIICSVCYNKSTQLTVVLVSGALQPYAVELNGTRYQLTRAHPVVLTLPEGSFALTGGPRGSATSPPQIFRFALPFFTHLKESRVAVINPDRTAILYAQSTAYYAKGTQPNPNEGPTYTIFANEASYFLPKPDYAFVEFPKQIQMPQNASRTTRTRLAQLNEGTLDQQAALLLTKSNYATMRRHLELLAALQPEDENLLRTATTLLKPPEARAFFEAHLKDRPVLVEWHRYYQQYADYRLPTIDLVKQYRGFLVAEPTSGVLLYLLGRVCGDPTEMRTLNERALAAPQPCYYAYYGLGVGALNRAEFVRALECFNAAEQKGLKSESLRYTQRLARLATGDYSHLLADALTGRKAAQGSLTAAGEEIACDLLAGLGKEAAEKVKTDCLAHIERTEHPSPKEREMAGAYLSAVIAYGTGDAAAFAREISKFDSPECAFQAAVSRCDHAAAATALKKMSDPASTGHLLCFLAAKLKGDNNAAEAYFGDARRAMAKEDRDMRLLASMLESPNPPEVEAIQSFLFNPDQKRIVMAALGWRYPDRRAYYFDWAKRMNFDPAFPHLLIEQATAAVAPPLS